MNIVSGGLLLGSDAVVEAIQDLLATQSVACVRRRAASSQTYAARKATILKGISSLKLHTDPLGSQFLNDSLPRRYLPVRRAPRINASFFRMVSTTKRATARTAGETRASRR